MSESLFSWSRRWRKWIAATMPVLASCVVCVTALLAPSPTFAAEAPARIELRARPMSDGMSYETAIAPVGDDPVSEARPSRAPVPTTGNAAGLGDEVEMVFEGFEFGFPSPSWTLLWNTDQSQCQSPYRWDDDSFTAFQGSFSGWCAGFSERESCAPQVTPNDGYPPFMNTVMIYGPLDFTDADAASWTFQYQSEIGSGDRFAWGASIEWPPPPGESADFWGFTISENSDGWTLGQLDFGDVPEIGGVLDRDDVYIGLFFISDEVDTNEQGVFVDNIRVVKTVPMPICLLGPTELDFETVEVGQFVDRTFSVQNIGSGTLDGVVGESCPDFQIVGDDSYSLAADETKLFTLRFQPTTAGPADCSVNAGADCGTVEASGTGTENQPPSITHEALTTASADADLTVTADVDDPDGDDLTVNLVYRLGGDLAFGMMPMTAKGAEFTATIPASQIAARGLEYYLSADDGQFEVLEPPTGADDPNAVDVTFTTLASPFELPGGTEQTAYRMVSVPVVTSTQNVRTLLEDDLGTYATDVWRFFRFDDDEFVENPTSPANLFSRGRAYWVITAEGRTFDVPSGQSAPLAEFEVTLEPGWNDVAVPYDFAIVAEDVELVGATGSEVDGPYAFDGSWVAPGNVTRLEPWRGYAYHYDGTGSPVLRFQPVAADAVPRGAPADASATLADDADGIGRRVPSDGEAVAAGGSAGGRAAGPAASVESDASGVSSSGAEWRLRLEVRAADAVDGDNVLGWSVSATDGKDRLDSREPRGVGGHVSLAFVSTDRDPSGWTWDLRAPKEDGDLWRVHLDGNVSGPVYLRAESVSPIPVGYVAKLWDPATGRMYDLLDGSLDLGATLPRDLIVLVGTPSFVESERDVVSLPERFRLFAPAPNPTRGSAEVRFQLPREGEVELAVFDPAGRLVSRLLGGRVPAGDRIVTWDGRNSVGAQAPSGTYFVRMRAGAYLETQKLLLIR